MSRPKARGRPPLKQGQALGAPLGLRLPADLMERLDKSAEERGWSRIDEIRRRLWESFSPLSTEAGAMANVLGLLVEQIQELTGKPLHTDPFSWVALHSALRLLIPADENVTIPEALEVEAAAWPGEGDPKQRAREFADGIGVRVWGEHMRMLERIDQPNYAASLTPGRRRFLEAIHQDFALHKLWAGRPKSGFITPPEPAKQQRKPKKKEASR